MFRNSTKTFINYIEYIKTKYCRKKKIIKLGLTTDPLKVPLLKVRTDTFPQKSI